MANSQTLSQKSTFWMHGKSKNQRVALVAGLFAFVAITSFIVYRTFAAEQFYVINAQQISAQCNPHSSCDGQLVPETDQTSKKANKQVWEVSGNDRLDIKRMFNAPGFEDGIIPAGEELTDVSTRLCAVAKIVEGSSSLGVGTLEGTWDILWHDSSATDYELKCSKWSPLGSNYGSINFHLHETANTVRISDIVVQTKPQ